jgi:DNA-binding NtrC family response regulator
VPTTLKEAERETIRRALEKTGGHRKRAAELLGIGLRTLYDKLKEYGLG